MKYPHLYTQGQATNVKKSNCVGAQLIRLKNNNQIVWMFGKRKLTLHRYPENNLFTFKD